MDYKIESQRNTVILISLYAIIIIRLVVEPPQSPYPLGRFGSDRATIAHRISGWFYGRLK